MSMKEKKKSIIPLVIFCFVFLSNPYVKIVDILPDFIAYFILAKMLERAADSAPFFEEARSSCVKLAWVSLLKLPAFMLLIFIRSNNTLDSDIYAMMSLIFAVVELIYLLPLIKNIFTALFYLGERGSAESLITPFPLGKSTKRVMRPEDLRGYAVMFSISKCILSVIPELFLLSRTTSSGVLMPATLQRYYPYALISAIAIVCVMGIILIIRSKHYVRAIENEGKFSTALSEIARAGSEAEFETKLLRRKIKKALLFLAISSVLTFPLALENTESINVLPGFLFCGLSLLSLMKLGIKKKERRLPLLISGGACALFSLLYFIFSAKFHTSYDYIDLTSVPAAKSAYIPLTVFAALEFVSLTVYLWFSLRYMYDFIYENTGVSPHGERYGKMERTYHSDIKKRCNFHFAFGIILGALKCVGVFLNSSVKLIHSTVGNAPVIITTSVVPWFSTVITVFAILYIGYSFYFTNYLKEECEMKYSQV